MFVGTWNEFLHLQDLDYYRRRLPLSAEVVDHHILMCTEETGEAFGELAKNHYFVRPGLKMTYRLREPTSEGWQWHIDDPRRWLTAGRQLAKMIETHGRQDVSLVAGIAWETALRAIARGEAIFEPDRLRHCFRILSAAVPEAWAVFWYPGIHGPAGGPYDVIAQLAADVFGRERTLLEVPNYRSRRDLFLTQCADRIVRADAIGRPVFKLDVLRHWPQHSDTLDARDAATFIRAAREHDGRVAIWTGQAGMELLGAVGRWL